MNQTILAHKVVLNSSVKRSVEAVSMEICTQMLVLAAHE
jgi:hypothetical protein